MTKYEITARESGENFGAFEGATEAEALDAFARDAGYSSYSDLADTLGKTQEEATEDLIITACS